MTLYGSDQLTLPKCMYVSPGNHLATQLKSFFTHIVKGDTETRITLVMLTHRMYVET